MGPAGVKPASRPSTRSAIKLQAPKVYEDRQSRTGPRCERFRPGNLPNPGHSQITAGCRILSSPPPTGSGAGSWSRDNRVCQLIRLRSDAFRQVVCIVCSPYASPPFFMKFRQSIDGSAASRVSELASRATAREPILWHRREIAQSTQKTVASESHRRCTLESTVCRNCTVRLRLRTFV